MTISELIKILPKNLSAKDVRAAFKKSFLASARKYSEDEKAILSAFCGNRTRMDNNNEVRTWQYKNVDEGTLKELTQYINRGVTSNDSHAAKPYTEDSAISNFRNKVEEAIENSIHGSIPKKIGKDKPIPQAELADHIFSDESVVYTMDGMLKELIDPKEIENYNRHDGRNFARDVYAAKGLIAELATFLAVESGVVDVSSADEFAAHECETIRSEIKDILKAREASDESIALIPVRFVKRVACAVADKIALNSGKPDAQTNKHFHDSQLQEMIDAQAREFTDIPFGFVAGDVAKETSNYNLGIINAYGDKQEFVNYDKAATLDALKGDKIGDVIDGVKKLADEVVKNDVFGKDQKMLVTNAKEGAIFSLVMLIATSASEIKDAPAKDLQQIYAPILAQCLDKLELENISTKEIVESAKKIVSELPIDVDLSAAELDDEIDSVGAETPAAEDVVAEPKKYNVNVKKEMSDFRKKLIKAIKALEKTQGLYNKKALKKENPQRKNSVFVKAALDVDQIGLNKGLKDFGQSVDELLLDLPVEAKEVMPVSVVLKKIYSGIYSKGQQLSDETKDKKYTNEEKKQLREKYGLTDEGAKDLIKEAYGEHFDEKGNFKKDDAPVV